MTLNKLYNLHPNATVAIVGGPRMGKTTYSKFAPQGVELFNTDDLKDLSWQQALPQIQDLLEGQGRVVEGVRVMAALRRNIREGRPLPSHVLYMTKPKNILSMKQAAMNKGIATTFGEIADVLANHSDVTLIR